MNPIPNAYPYFDDVNEGILRQLPVIDAEAPVPRVLDLGCGYGALGQAIRARGYEVWGIESNPTATEKAEKRLDRFFEGDIGDAAGLRELLGGTTFDILILSDVLEHLPDANAALRSYLPFLTDSGSIIISVPNVANWQTRFGLFLGRFEYTDVGVLDRTHLRFFTMKSAQQLIAEVGCTVTHIDFTPMIVRALAPHAKRVLSRKFNKNQDATRAIIDAPLYGLYLKFVYPIEYFMCRRFPGLLAFRIIVVASSTPH